MKQIKMFAMMLIFLAFAVVISEAFIGGFNVNDCRSSVATSVSASGESELKYDSETGLTTQEGGAFVYLVTDEGGVEYYRTQDLVDGRLKDGATPIGSKTNAELNAASDSNKFNIIRNQAQNEEVKERVSQGATGSGFSVGDMTVVTSPEEDRYTIGGKEIVCENKLNGNCYEVFRDNDGSFLAERAMSPADVNSHINQHLSPQERAQFVDQLSNAKVEDEKVQIAMQEQDKDTQLAAASGSEPASAGSEPVKVGIDSPGTSISGNTGFKIENQADGKQKITVGGVTYTCANVEGWQCHDGKGNVRSRENLLDKGFNEEQKTELAAINEQRTKDAQLASSTGSRTATATGKKVDPGVYTKGDGEFIVNPSDPKYKYKVEKDKDGKDVVIVYDKDGKELTRLDPNDPKANTATKQIFAASGAVASTTGSEPATAAGKPKVDPKTVVKPKVLAKPKGNCECLLAGMEYCE